MVIYSIFLFINFMKINALLSISLEITGVDDCLEKITLENNVIFQLTYCEPSIQHKIFEISYELGKKIVIQVFDQGGISC